MEIRDEIERMKIPDATLDLLEREGYAFTALQERNHMIADVLSILDKWECVEGEWQRYGYMYYDDGESLASFGASICELIRFRLHSEEGHTDVEIKPGDHIIILRRRKDE